MDKQKKTVLLFSQPTPSPLPPQAAPIPHFYFNTQYDITPLRPIISSDFTQLSTLSPNPTYSKSGSRKRPEFRSLRDVTETETETEDDDVLQKLSWVGGGEARDDSRDGTLLQTYIYIIPNKLLLGP